MSSCSLTHRERVRRAIAYQDIDRIPMRYNGRTEVDTVLAQYLGIPLEGDWHEALMRRLDIDVRNLYAEPVVPRDYVSTAPLFPNITEAKDVHRLWPEGLKVANRDFAALAGLARRFDEGGNPVWLSLTTNSLFTDTTKLLGVEKALMGMADNDPVVVAMFDRFEEFISGYIERATATLQGRLDMVHVGDDLGTQTGPFVSPRAIETHLIPRYQHFIECIHTAGAKCFFHCCGAIHDIIPMFIDAGVDILNPLQPCAENMRPEALARDFGGKVAFCGGIDMQHLLPFGTPEEVAQEVRRYIDVLGRHGGYILDSANILHTDNPPRNIEAMFRAGREYRLNAI